MTRTVPPNRRLEYELLDPAQKPAWLEVNGIPSPDPTPTSIEDRAADVLGTRAGRRALGLASPEWWDSYYAKMRPAAHRTRLLEKMDKAINDSRSRKILILEPRGHGKTEAITTMIARAICYNRNARVLLVCANEGQAILRLNRIKAILRSKRIMEDFCQDPDQGFWAWGEQDDDRWRETQIQVTRTVDSVDPTILAVGRGGKAVTGAHPTIVVADDIEDTNSVLTSGERDKTKSWFKATLMPTLLPGGTLIVIGTKKHHDDLYAFLEDNPVFESIKEPAVLDWPEDYTVNYTQKGKFKGVAINGDKPPTVLWPEERPFEWLIGEKIAMSGEDGGAREWLREFQHEVQDDSTSAVQLEWLKAAQEKGSQYSLYQPPQGLTLAGIYQGWDFSLVDDPKHAARQDTDYTVGLTWARTHDDQRILLGINRQRGLSQEALFHLVEQEYRRFVELGLKPRQVAVERNNFGRLHYVGLVQRNRIPVVPHDTTAKSKADPWVGIPGLSMLFEQSRVILPSRTRQDRKAILPLQQELHGLGVEKHDDCAMALHVVESVARLQPGQAPPITKQGGILRADANQEAPSRRRRRSRIKPNAPPPGAKRFTNRGWEQ